MLGAKKPTGIKSKSACNVIISLKGKLLINYFCHLNCVNAKLPMQQNTLCSARCLCALNEKWNNNKVKWTAPWNSSGTLFGTEKRTSDLSLKFFITTDNSK